MLTPSAQPMTNNLEIEIKLKVPTSDIPTLRQRILDLGFTLYDSDSFESNIVFDTPDNQLKNKHMLLRLRQKKNKNIITFKRPVEHPQDSTLYKIKEELEMTVSDFEMAKAILMGLGYRIFFIYEKYREIFAFTQGTDTVKVMIDRTPIGYFLEIEGSCQQIDWLAELLGYRQEDYITANYLTLFRELFPTGFMQFA